MVLVSSSLFFSLRPRNEDTEPLLFGTAASCMFIFCFLGEEAPFVGTRKNWRLPSHSTGGQCRQSREKRTLFTEIPGHPWIK